MPNFISTDDNKGGKITLTGANALTGGSVFKKDGSARTKGMYNFVENSAKEFATDLLKNIGKKNRWVKDTAHNMGN